MDHFDDIKILGQNGTFGFLVGEVTELPRSGQHDGYLQSVVMSDPLRVFL